MMPSNNPKPKIDIGFLILALIASLGLAISLVTIWHAWSEPMVFLPGNYVPILMGIVTAIGIAIYMTYQQSAVHLKTFIGCAILIAILLQLNVLGLTIAGHNPPPTNPARNDHPAAVHTEAPAAHTASKAVK